MATHEIKVYEVKIEECPNADALEIARIGGYRSIVQKGKYKTGNKVAYIPEDSVLPEWLITKMGLEGRLAGKAKNRVKAIRLRNTLSQGLIYPVAELNDGLYLSTETILTRINESSDLCSVLGITKYEPKIPVHMSGEVFNARGMTLTYDIENIKKFTDVLQENEEVVITEKIHGTFVLFGYNPDSDVPLISSKGLSAQGLAFKLNEVNEKNLYVKVFNSLTENDKTIIVRAKEVFGDDEPFYILGEVYGQGVQDLTYGLNNPEFRMFDVYLGQPGKGEYVDAIDISRYGKDLNVNTVPILYQGPYNADVLNEYTSGRETVSGSESHIREGVVIKPSYERQDVALGRTVLKSVSEKYLTRKGNVTEFQ